MEKKQEDIIYELIATGVYDKGKIDNLFDIQSVLRKVHFDVVEWYDKSYYILIHTGSTKELSLGYNEVENQEILSVFESMIYEKEITENILDSLIENLWVELDENGKYRLTKRCLVIFKDDLLKFGDVYKECKICTFLVYKKEMHEFCESVFCEGN